MSKFLEDFQIKPEANACYTWQFINSNSDFREYDKASSKTMLLVWIFVYLVYSLGPPKENFVNSLHFPSCDKEIICRKLGNFHKLTSVSQKKTSCQPVTGRVNLDNLGVVLPHEHLHMQFDCVVQDPPDVYPTYPRVKEDTFSLSKLGMLRQYPYSSPYNCKLDDKNANNVMVDEVLKFKEAGGGTIVENTIEGISRNIPFLKSISEQTKVNIIAGTGFYVACSQQQSTLKLTIEELHDIMLQELTEGANGIKCGVIGEIGISYPMDPFEKRVIEAVAILQEETQAPISFHPGRSSKSAFEIIRVFTEAGGNSEDVVMSHLDRTLQDKAELLEFAKFKTFTQFDLFGIENSFYQLAEEIDMPSDAQRIDRILTLKENGHINQVTMSHDIHTKHRLENFGGHGFGHILKNVVPKMLTKGFSKNDLDIILKENPKRWLSRGKY